jgi:2-haloacid dehalogenase
MLEAAVAAADLGADLDFVLSVDSIRMYKPRPEVYALVPAAMKVETADVVFVSSNRWDVMGAASFGFRAAWINRAGLPDEYIDAGPMMVLRDLGGLLTSGGS